MSSQAAHARSSLDPRPAVLLLHGLCANPLELMPLARTLRTAGYVVEVPALPGYGVAADAGGQRMPVTRFEAWVDQAARHFDALAETHQRVAVGGLSMGSVLALALAMERPAAALMLLSTSLHFDGWNVSPWRRLLPLAYLPPLRHWLKFRESPPYGIKNERLREWVAQAMTSSHVSAAGADTLPATALYQASRMIRRVRAGLSRIEAPTVILHATQDDVSGPRSVAELKRRLGTHPEVHWFHDSYHMLTLDNERGAVSQAASRFLQREVPAPRTNPDNGFVSPVVSSAFPHPQEESFHEQHA
ncbi:MAG: alpha/beta fold hydrolase [Burkholderiaceae bacterium]